MVWEIKNKKLNIKPNDTFEVTLIYQNISNVYH